MSAEQLDARQRGAFLQWRRDLAHMEEVEGLVLTPFEKNLEVWAQLWRVLERSDAVVQVGPQCLTHAERIKRQAGLAQHACGGGPVVLTPVEKNLEIWAQL